MTIVGALSASELYENACATINSDLVAPHNISEFYDMSCEVTGTTAPEIVDIEADILFTHVNIELVLTIQDINNIGLGSSSTYYWGFTLYKNGSMLMNQVRVVSGTQYAILANPGTYTVDVLVYKGGQIVFNEASLSSITIA